VFEQISTYIVESKHLAETEWQADLNSKNKVRGKSVDEPVKDDMQIYRHHWCNGALKKYN
jgi:hypothetical protein